MSTTQLGKIKLAGDLGGTILLPQVVSVLDGKAPEVTINKGAANGYASLGADGLVPAAQLPASQGGAAWGAITGTLANQTDLGTALSGKAASSHAHAATDVTGTAVLTADARLSDARTPLAHSHAAADVTGTAVLTADARLSDARTPTAHATSHQNGGADEISVAGLSGLLADAQTAAAHTHVAGDITGTAVLTADSRLSDSRTPLAHATSHKTGGSDAIKLDELAAPTDVTTLNATTAQHGLLPKLPGGTSTFLRADGAFAAPPGGGITTLRTTVNQTINGGAATFVDITGLTFAVTNGVDYAFEFYITFRSAAATTGWKASVNCPAGTLDFWAGSDIIANGAAGVATHTERHNVTRDDMTLLTATITQAVDLNVRIRGRYLCTANGLFAARFANELAANTDLVVQKGSWGWYF